MNNKIKITTKLSVITLIGWLAISSCKKYFTKINTDPKSLSENLVTPEGLFTYAQKQLTDFMSTSSVNINVFRFFAQYVTNPTYTTEPRYNIINRNISNRVYISLYRNVLSNLNQAEKVVLAKESENKAKLGAIQLLKIYTFALLVEVFGDVPYTEALDIDNIHPKYEDAKTVYYDLLDNKLPAAIANLDGGGKNLAGADLVYNGDPNKWKKFAYSLMLRMGVMLIKSDKNKAEAIIKKAVQGGVFSTQSDSYIFNYYAAPPNTNPIYDGQELGNRNDFFATTTLLDSMTFSDKKGDPRLPYYFNVANNNNNSGDSVIGTKYKISQFKGVRYAAQEDNLDTFSNIKNGIINRATLPGILLDYMEVEFLLAEACINGVNLNGTDKNGKAKEHLDKGIAASLTYWHSLDPSKIEDINKVIAYYKTKKPDLANTAPTKKTVAVEMWLALYNRGYEGWNVWRRYGETPAFFIIPEGQKLPIRMTYPISEGQTNQANITQAISRIGGDLLTTKLFFFKDFKFK